MNEFSNAGVPLSAEADLDFRGTLGVSKEASAGFRAIRVGSPPVTVSGELRGVR